MASAITTEFFEDNDVIIIDPNQKQLDNFSRFDVGLICADMLNIETLNNSDIKNADVFIACSNNDESNIIACLMSKQVTKAQTICFVSKKESLESLNSLREERKSSYAQAIENVIWPQKLLMQEIFKISCEFTAFSAIVQSFFTASASLRLVFPPGKRYNNDGKAFFPPFIRGCFWPGVPSGPISARS